MRLVHGSTFSGIGGAEVAASMCGWENAFHCEINPFGRQILDYYYPNAKSYEDITKADFSEWGGRIDVLTGGFPCQPFSVAGKRCGANDDRYLWPFMLRVIEQVRPTWFVGENVAGIATMALPGKTTEMGCNTSLFGEGDHYTRTVERYVIEEICSNLEAIGYSVQPMLIPACAVGAPHRRDRIWFIAHDERNASNNPKSGGDARESRKVQGTEGEERLQERNGVQLLEQPSSVRSSFQETSANSKDKRFQHTIHGRAEGEVCGEKGVGREDGNSVMFVPTSPDGIRWHSSNTACSERKSRLQGRERTSDCKESRAEANDRAERYGSQWDASRLLPERRWKDFPTISPIHRGNDGIPFDVDGLSISFNKWREESIKAYGNAWVVQVAYEIFKAIESTYQ